MQPRRHEGTKTRVRFHETHETAKTRKRLARFDAERPAEQAAVTGIENRLDEQTRRRNVCSSGRFSMPEAAAARRRVEPKVFFAPSCLRGSRFVVSWFPVLVARFAS